MFNVLYFICNIHNIYSIIYTLHAMLNIYVQCQKCICAMLNILRVTSCINIFDLLRMCNVKNICATFDTINSILKNICSMFSRRQRFIQEVGEPD